jgi:hypothetical protein
MILDFGLQILDFAKKHEPLILICTLQIRNHKS